jgi:hypothetical protein
MPSTRDGLAAVHRFRDVNQFRKYSAEWRIVRPTEREGEFAVERIEPVIHRLSQRVGLINFVQGTDLILRFLHCGESAGSKKRENCGAEARDTGTWHEDGTAKNVCVDMVENRIFCGIPPTSSRFASRTSSRSLGRSISPEPKSWNCVVQVTVCRAW